MPEPPSSSFIGPGLRADWHQKMRRRLAWLRDIGVMGKVHLDVQPDGLPGFHGMPQEAPGDFLPEVVGPELVALALRDTRNHPIMGGPIAVFKGRDPNTHVAWGKALEQLEALCVSNTAATTSDVADILFEARGGYLDDWDQLADFLKMGKKDYRCVLNQDKPVIAWLCQCMARTFGVQAPSEPDEDWWATAREHIELGNDERFFSLTDMVWRRLREVRRLGERDGLDGKALIGAQKVVGLVEEFMGHDKNGSILDMLENATFED